ncbi:hypothetical protein [Aestuariivivens sediminis]|uniref:hypothetical protein n=1 Tax=Aestuariivivens sediminis TaxID=2913557 RepID=UPI001F597C49|nr:hypothetical protein [Aestuariivivens sediminis]
MKHHLIITLLLLSLHSTMAQSFHDASSSGQQALDLPTDTIQIRSNPFRAINAITGYNLRMLDTLEALLREKNTNTQDLLRLVRTHNIQVRSRMLLADIKLDEIQQELLNTREQVRTERKTGLWRTMGAGIGGVALGIVTGILIKN